MQFHLDGNAGVNRKRCTTSPAALDWKLQRRAEALGSWNSYRPNLVGCNTFCTQRFADFVKNKKN